ncbi:MULTISPECIES: Crp/Fnr family transcriptional regulator [Tenacibaculum]|uniref:Crp/Fnr family transcriptional regulator n=1 Tax=Tenacibaculum TaxID=104267 RepID=UPI00089CCEFE|nr:Crp/Fnr family transcriptional regulator [Tenacibaculum sp. MAR_2010_89]SEE40280.1 cAMP-binding domain of CRP or a regulatory subunit of cAMP-dependent protein kinases [Tenacibaculum sp. MAR_2010_89]
MNELHKILEELIGLTDNEWGVFKSLLKKRDVKAKTLIIKEGSIAKNLYFIDSGLLRSYYFLDGKEINSYFSCDNQFISIFSSFINQTPSLEILETIEDSCVYELSYYSLSELYTKSANFEKLGRILAEKNYLCALERTSTMQTKTAKEKYLDFIKKYNKKIVQRVPQHQIASFLGIAPESLSRVRKEITIS